MQVLLGKLMMQSAEAAMEGNQNEKRNHRRCRCARGCEKSTSLLCDSLL